MTSRYRIVPARFTSGTYIIQKKGWFFWNSQAFPKVLYDTFSEAVEGVARLVHEDRMKKERELRRKSWIRAVPKVYFDEKGEPIVKKT